MAMSVASGANNEALLHHQASVFYTENQTEIANVRSLLLQAAEDIACRIEWSHGTLATSIRYWLKFGFLEEAFSTVRSNTVIICRMIGSEKFWNWVDAVNFLTDSFSTHWKYMTVDMRKQCLVWAKQFAQKLIEAK